MSSGYNQGGFPPPPQGGYPGQGYGQPGVPPRPPAASGGGAVSPVVIWIILGATALNLILTSVILVRSLAAEAAARDALEQLDGLNPGSFPGTGTLPDLGG